MDQPVVLLVHGAFAESAGWNRVIQRLRGNQLTTVAGASHALAASQPDAVTATILDAVDRARG
ncbi:hypothetical protein ACFY3V_00345 [Streptosporangium sp. NPDC000095]